MLHGQKTIERPRSRQTMQAKANGLQVIKVQLLRTRDAGNLLRLKICEFGSHNTIPDNLWLSLH